MADEQEKTQQTQPKGIDPKTGKPFREDGYKLRANVGPAASPVPFGPGHAFAPLTDGTVLLLDLKQLR